MGRKRKKIPSGKEEFNGSVQNRFGNNRKEVRTMEQGLEIKSGRKTTELGTRIFLLSAGPAGCNFKTLYPDFLKDKKEPAKKT